LEFSQNLKSNNSFILIFKLKVTEHEQRKSQCEINLREATNEIESLRKTVKENEESHEGFYVSLFKNINDT
jgi:hypothetical protein